MNAINQATFSSVPMQNTTNAGSIAASYGKYLAIFGEISNALQLDNVENDIFNYNDAFSMVQDQHGGFRVWAGNMDAHRVGRISLDHKLREASHIHRSVVKLLGGLIGGLKECMYFATSPDYEHFMIFC